MKLVNRVLAALLSLGLIGLGAVLIIEVIAHRIGSAPVLLQWPAAYSWGARTTWDSTTMRIVTIVTGVVGLLLLLAEFKRAPVRRLPVANAADHVDIAYTPRGVAGAVKSAAADVDGVRSASAVVRRRAIRVSAVAFATRTGAAKSLTGAVTDAVHRQVNAMKLDPAPRVAVAVRARKR